MKAMESYHSGTVGFDILHTDVVETSIDHHLGHNKVFKCRHCGSEWVQSINSPQILSEDVEKEIREYYPKFTECKSSKS